MPEMAPNLPRDRPGGTRPKAPRDSRKTRMTNGSALLPGVDGRLLWVKRCKEILADHLGDKPDATAAEQAIIRRAAVMIVELERLERQFALAGEADPDTLDLYGRVAGNMRRLLESVGIDRRPKVVGPSLSELLALDQRSAGAHQNGQGNAHARFPGHPPSGVGADPETAPAALLAESGARHSAGEGSPPMLAAEAENAPAANVGPGAAESGATE